ncbi:MAG TPA: LysR substrate-binding domain-containing protein [Burkholderiaceae bacterium]|nr:LysR substrate-binding domain-containing protein [Burkholderiaceae bacterium]
MDKRRYPRLSLDLLRGFRVAARHLSFTRASQELFVTQSAISREIKTLEDQIGQPLFQRLHRALQLTRAGEELYRAADEALTLLDAVTNRLSGSAKALTVTTTTALASLWLAPRLPRFNRLHPQIDVRIVATNDKPDLEREQLDIAIRFVSPDGDSPDAEQLMTAVCFPVCAPPLACDRARPLHALDDLALHVRLDYEGARDGRRFSEWDFWFDAMKIRPIEPTSTLRFSQYDQWLPAAIEGAGVAIGVLPHLTQQLRDGVLCAPFGRDAIAKRGSFFIVLRRDVAERDAVKAFVDWLRSEVRRDRELTLAAPHMTKRTATGRAQTPGARTRARRH